MLTCWVNTYILSVNDKELKERIQNSKISSCPAFDGLLYLMSFIFNFEFLMLSSSLHKNYFFFKSCLPSTKASLGVKLNLFFVSRELLYPKEKNRKQEKQKQIEQAKCEFCVVCMFVLLYFLYKCHPVKPLRVIQDAHKKVYKFSFLHYWVLFQNTHILRTGDISKPI